MDDELLAPRPATRIIGFLGVMLCPLVAAAGAAVLALMMSLPGFPGPRFAFLIGGLMLAVGAATMLGPVIGVRPGPANAQVYAATHALAFSLLVAVAWSRGDSTTAADAATAGCTSVLSVYMQSARRGNFGEWALARRGWRGARP